MCPFLSKINQQWTIKQISIFTTSSHLEWRSGLSDPIVKWGHPHKDHSSKILFNLVQWFQRRSFKCESLRSTTNAYEVRRTPSDGKTEANSGAPEGYAVLAPRVTLVELFRLQVRG
jgi:hypothetical protein